MITQLQKITNTITYRLEEMTKTKKDDSRNFETFRIITKYHEHPDKLTRKEKKRLKVLGMTVDKKV